MIAYNECGYCQSPIAPGQRWVREKVYDPFLNTGGDPIYRRYHAEVPEGQELSCWEKRQLEQEFARTAFRAA